MLSKMCSNNICRVSLDASKNANLTYPTPWFILWLWMKNQMKQWQGALTNSQNTEDSGETLHVPRAFHGQSPNFRCGWNIPLGAATWRLFSPFFHTNHWDCFFWEWNVEPNLVRWCRESLCTAPLEPGKKPWLAYHLYFVRGRGGSKVRTCRNRETEKVE